MIGIVGDAEPFNKLHLDLSANTIMLDGISVLKRILFQRIKEFLQRDAFSASKRPKQ